MAEKKHENSQVIIQKVLQSWIFHKKRVSKVSLASKTSRILTTCNDSNRGRTSTSKMHTTQQPQSQREGAPIPPNERTSTIRMLSQAIKSTLTVRRTHTHIASTNAFSLNCKEAMTLKRWRSYVVRHRDACLPNLVLPINAGNPEVEKKLQIRRKNLVCKTVIFTYNEKMPPLEPESEDANALFSMPRMLLMASNSNCSEYFCLTLFFTNLSQ